jgi:hypothetical protein
MLLAYPLVSFEPPASLSTENLRMLRHELLGNEGIRIMRPRVLLGANDFAELAAKVDSYTGASGDRRGLVLEAESFPGWEDADGFLSHLRFIRDHHRHTGKVAVIPASAILSVAPSIADHFVLSQVRHFGSDGRDAAMHWLRQPQHGHGRD